MITKQKVLEVIQNMPDNATFDQINVDLQILRSIEESKDRSNLLTTDQVRENATRAIEKAAADSKYLANG